MLQDAFGVHGFDGLESHQEPTHDAKNFYRLVEEGEIELYPGCANSKLSFLCEWLVRYLYVNPFGISKEVFAQGSDFAFFIF
ncbi:unnamed protein product [Prunus armeniaca]|uniref:Uncharacterized protein n=1 Tax=Prunus armeniaca TaxID=36596 RepID=A0A6J5TJ82_PRUAR|nr:unnamed protein product [Prunus armeniaca]